MIYVIKKLKSKKVGGVDDILPEHFKALISTEQGLELVLELCQICWEKQEYPEILENLESCSFIQKWGSVHLRKLSSNFSFVHGVQNRCGNLINSFEKWWR